MDAADLEKFADNLKAKFALAGTASPEDQLKPDVAALFVAAGAKLGLKVETRTETHLSEHKVRPDIAVYVGGLMRLRRVEGPRSRGGRAEAERRP